MIKGIIYKYTSPSNKSYIGKTINEKLRMSQHENRTSKKNTKFGCAIRKYGFENFKYDVLFEIKNNNKDIINKKLNEMEIYFIDLFDTQTNGYNSTKGGDGGDVYESSYKPIYQYSKEGIYIKSFDSVIEAMEAININKNMFKTHIDNNTTFKGFLWSREKHDKIEPDENKITKTRKEVYQYDLYGNLIQKFESIYEAASKIKIKDKYISRILNKEGYSYHGFIFRTKDQQPPEQYKFNFRQLCNEYEKFINKELDQNPIKQDNESKYLTRCLNTIGLDKVKELNFDKQKIGHNIDDYLINNSIDIKNYIIDTFKVDTVYSLDEVNNLLKIIYNKLEIKKVPVSVLIKDYLETKKLTKEGKVLYKILSIK